MNIELLVIQNCPNEQPAARSLRTALNDIGLDQIQFRIVTIADPETAERTSFTGSPSFMIDGVDLFNDPTRPTGLSCRLYQNSHGVAGVPGPHELRRALRESLHQRLSH